MRPTAKENGEYGSDCCRFEEQTRDARDKALLVLCVCVFMSMAFEILTK